ncbi:LPXTG cell wall anchor domain-containing protein [Amycolatopsis silviterrae]|uniref:LPXTG cell wall anchor domain-containing protein n=1 Tax=Amycolatopsis silviterrae TaxID=1656914 RepID=A0ABW5H9D4_9PSEU
MKRTLVLTGAVAAAVFAANPASAATAPAGPSASDTAAISGLLASPGTAARLAHTKFPGAAPAAAHATRAAADASTQIPVYEPTAAFVNGASDVPAALAYVASPAHLADGRDATVWTQPSASGWQVINVASGNDEQVHAAAAHGGYLLHEPQVNAWYSVNGDTVTVLDGSVSGVPNGTRVTLATYQAELHKRYGDKLPGSTYDKTGAGGGYAAPASNTGSDDSPATALALGGAAVAAAGGAFLLRRRSQHSK